MYFSEVMENLNNAIVLLCGSVQWHRVFIRISINQIQSLFYIFFQPMCIKYRVDKSANYQSAAISLLNKTHQQTIQPLSRRMLIHLQNILMTFIIILLFFSPYIDSNCQEGFKAFLANSSFFINSVKVISVTVVSPTLSKSRTRTSFVLRSNISEIKESRIRYLFTTSMKKIPSSRPL